MFRKRRNFRRKYGRSKTRFRPSRIQKSRRIFKRFIRRTAIRPELKFVDAQQTIPNIIPLTSRSFKLSPDAIETGVSRSQRTGAQVKFIKVDLNAVFRNNSSTTSPAVAPSIQSANHRFIIWTPRVDITAAINYMNSITNYAVLFDYNIITIVRDITFALSPPYMSEATTNDIAGGPRPYEIMKKFKIPHPRKVKFFNQAGTIDEERYTLYCTIVTSYLDTIMILNTRTFYFDA